MELGDEASALAATQVWLRYRRGVQALRGVDLHLPEGSTTALIGPNGAGKTTLIKIWLGFEKPSSGHAAVFGADPWTERAKAIREIGYVPQATSLYRDLTVDDHLAMARSLRPGFDRDYAVCRLSRSGIPLRSAAGELSGGQSAQVALALALGTRARILLLDEPLASLDPLARREFLEVLREAVEAEGTTVVLSSHVISDVEEACSRVVVLGRGRVVLDSELADSLRRHLAGSPELQIATSKALTHVADMPGRNGQRLRLWRRQTDDGAPIHGLRPASVEEVVMGYLVAARDEPAVG